MLGPIRQSQEAGFPHHRPRDVENRGNKRSNKKPEAPAAPRRSDPGEGLGTHLDIDV